MVMRTHAAILKDAEADKLAEHLGLSVNTVRAWRQRDSIPGEYWKQIDGLGIATLEELAEAAASKRAAEPEQRPAA